MQSESIWRYIFLGTALRYLQDHETGWRIQGEGRLLNNIEFVEYLLEQAGLVVSARAFEREVMPIKRRLQEAAEDAVLEEQDAADLHDAVNGFRIALEAEAEGKVAFIVTDRRYDANKLLTDVGHLLRPGIYESLPDIAKVDMAEAGRALAFELPTAAAFHLLRATEQVLRDYYVAWVKRNRVNPLLWGPMVSSLRRRSKSPPDALLNHLDHIRKNFRNPTDHPEKIYDIEEAQDLFALCCDAIGRMTPPAVTP